MPRKICIITGSRAEYGHLRWLARIVADDPDLALQWVVTGSHLSEKFDLTYREIEADGFEIDEKVPLPLSDDTNLSIARAMGAAVGLLAEAFDRLRPAIIVILGDRYEMLAAATAAAVLRIPIAHLHGGEVTEGAFDELFRHAITKMAQLHFASAEPYRQRILQLGEAPERIILSGAPGMDFLEQLEIPSLTDLAARLGQPLSAGFLLVTYHPVTLENDDAASVAELLSALDDFPERTAVITGVNADPGSDQISSLFRDFANARPGRVVLVGSLGQTYYLAAMKFAGAVVGNSSSGMLEAPAVGTPTLNIGNRQKGRLRASSIVDSLADSDSIRAGLETVLNPDFRERYCDGSSPYRIGSASKIIAEALKNVSLQELSQKSFHDHPKDRKSRVA